MFRLKILPILDKIWILEGLSDAVTDFALDKRNESAWLGSSYTLQEYWLLGETVDNEEWSYP